MAHILVLTLVFPPDNVSTAVILGELSTDLGAAGHEVTVVTTVPHYNRDLNAETRQPLVRKWGPLLSCSEFHGIQVLHVGMPRKSGRVFSRLLAWSQFHVLSLIAAVALVRRVDVILAPSPPLTIGLCAWLLACLYRAPYIYNVQELYPDIAIALGAVKRRSIIRVLLALERFVYARARIITVIAPRMRRRILDKGVSDDKVRLIPNFVDVHDMAPLSRGNGFKHEHRIHEPFVVSYAGNMGPAQGLEIVLHAAALLRHDQGLLFLLVGDGSSRSTLMAMARDRGLSNVRFLPYQPYRVVPQIYAASDLCLVSLALNTGSDAIPSKVYRIMACARPVLACADADSDLAELVRTTGAGMIVPPGSAEALAQAVSDAKRNPASCAAMGRSGRAHVVTEYARESVSGQYDALVREVAAARRPKRMGV